MKPLLSPQQAAKLLDEVVYERVVEHVDLAAIHAFECELGQLLVDLGPSPGAAMGPLGTAKAMIEAALARVATDPRRIMSIGGFPDDDCPLCAVAPPAPPRSATPPT